MKTTTQNTYYQRIHHVLLFIQSNLDGDLSLDTLAATAHFSPIHFHRIFKGMVGETLVEHVRRIRLERAAIRLSIGTSTVTDAAFDAGYGTVESFSRSFKKMFGCPPSKYQITHWEKLYKRIPGSVHFLPAEVRPNLVINREKETDMKVTITTVAPMQVAFVRNIGPYDGCQKAWKTLCNWAGPKGLLIETAKFIGVCYDDPQVTPAKNIRYDACISIDNNIEVEGEVGMQTLSGGEYAVALHKGPYSNLEKTYAELMGIWLPQSRREFREAPSFEIYLNDPENTPAEELLTELYLPLK
jgi:AraC family transcriptional regulator